MQWYAALAAAGVVVATASMAVSAQSPLSDLTPATSTLANGEGMFRAA
jgi:hypothetical protein